MCERFYKDMIVIDEGVKAMLPQTTNKKRLKQLEKKISKKEVEIEVGRIENKKKIDISFDV